MDKATSAVAAGKKKSTYGKFRPCTAPRYLPGSVHTALIQADLKEYNKHRYKVFIATSKLDTKPLHFCTDKYIQPMRIQGDMFTLRFIDKTNKNLLQKINKINRTQGYVDTFNPAAYKNLSNWQVKEQELNVIKRDNQKMYKRLMAASSVYSRAEHEKDWQNVLAKMQHFAKYPLPLKDKKTKDDELREYPSLTQGLSIADETSRPRCFMDFKIEGGLKLGRIIVELYNDIVPGAVDNFLSVCCGRTKHTYKNSTVHKIYQDKYCILGGATTNTAARSKRCTGQQDKFRDDKCLLKYSRPGVLSTIALGDSHVQHKFCITFTALPDWNGRQTIFGKVVRGAASVHKINDLGSKHGRPLVNIFVTGCGRLPAQPNK